MNAITKLKPMQQYMLKVFDRDLNEKQELEIKQILSNYFAKLVDEEMDKIVFERGLSQKDLDIALKKHIRTPYKPK